MLFLLVLMIMLGCGHLGKVVKIGNIGMNSCSVVQLLTFIMTIVATWSEGG